MAIKSSINLFLKYTISLLLIIIIDNSTFAKNTRLNFEYNKQQINISKLLDNLLKGYNNNIRPGYGGEPVIIEVDIMVRSMGPISEIDMTYSLDCYFRQSWIDRRLAFNSKQNTLALSISMLEKIWKPDTYFYNGKYSYLHTITTPNKFVRLYQDGRVLYSSRLTIKAGCSMNLEDFPMDIQRCPLKFGSFGYTTTDLIYRWNGARKAVAIANDMKLSQFDLIDCPVDDLTNFITHNLTNYIKTKELNTKSIAQHSILLVNFHLKRHMGNFLIQVYGPCILLVVLSWVSFWLNREATADRVSLGITTVLTMTFLGLEARTDLPKVSYPTALDFFVFLSFAFIFASIIQFAIVHYFTKYGSGEFYFYRDDLNNYNLKPDNLLREQINKNNKIFEVIPLSACKIVKSKSTIGGGLRNKLQTLQSTTNKHVFTPIPNSTIQFNSTDIQQQNQLNQIRYKKIATTHRTITFNSVSKIDKLSRIFFPLIFFFINLFYWVLYLTKNK